MAHILINLPIETFPPLSLIWAEKVMHHRLWFLGMSYFADAYGDVGDNFLVLVSFWIFYGWQQIRHRHPINYRLSTGCQNVCDRFGMLAEIFVTNMIIPISQMYNQRISKSVFGRQDSSPIMIKSLLTKLDVSERAI